MTAQDLDQIKAAIREVLAEERQRESVSMDMAYLVTLPMAEQKRILKERRERNAKCNDSNR